MLVNLFMGVVTLQYCVKSADNSHRQNHITVLASHINIMLISDKRQYFTRGEDNTASWIWKDLPRGVCCERIPK